MGRKTNLGASVILSWVVWLPLLVNAQTKSIVIGEGVRGAMYLPAYIAEEKGFFNRRERDTKIVTFGRSNDIHALVDAVRSN